MPDKHEGDFAPEPDVEISEQVHGFIVSSTGRIILRIDVVERGLLTSLLEQMIDLVTPDDDDQEVDPLARMVGIDAQVTRPQDPAVARLFPDAYRDDEQAADDFRRFTERGLREHKQANARTALDSLEGSGSKVTLSPDQAHAWLGALTDVRLVLGARLELTDDNHDELVTLPDDDPRSATVHIYDWLTYLQETLVRCLISSTPQH
jgi:hypothetical protein